MFVLSVRCPPPPSPNRLTRVAGVVVDGVTEAPLSGVRVESRRQVTTAAPDGRFSVDLENGDTELRVLADGYLDAVAFIKGPDIETRLFLSTFAETVEVVSQTTLERPSATRMVQREVFLAPGSIHNVFRTLDTLPGVASTDDFGSRLAVRGEHRTRT